MGCKFIRDVERFNEWGVRANYMVMKYGRKVNCLRLPDEVSKEARTKQRAGGGRVEMTPCSILTGLRGQRGEVMWRTV